MDGLLDLLHRNEKVPIPWDIRRLDICSVHLLFLSWPACVCVFARRQQFFVCLLCWTFWNEFLNFVCLKEFLMADEEDDGGEVQEDVQDQEYAGGGGLEETSDSSAADEELDGDQDDPDNGGRPAVISAGPSSSVDSLLNGSNNLAGIKEPTTFRPPIWQSVGNVSGQAVTFKGIHILLGQPQPTHSARFDVFCPAFCVHPFFF
jgi:hypothetical protein